MKYSCEKRYKPDAVIIFSGFNQRSVITMCRTLKACNINYYIIAHGNKDTIFQTSYSSHVSIVRSNENLEIDDLKKCIEFVRSGSSSRFLIAPTSEALNLYLLKHRDRIESSGDILPLVPENIYKEISNKYSFAKRCQDLGIYVPKELNNSEIHSLPVVAKPIVGTSSDGRSLYPRLLYNETDWNDFISSQDRSSYFLQQYIQGPSFYLQYYFHSSRKVDRFSMRNLVQQPAGKSIVAAEPSTLHLDSISDDFTHLLQEMNFKGLIMIEVMLENNRYYMIEANPRMWGPAQLMLNTGVNLYVSLINDFFETTFPLDVCGRAESPLYFWWAGYWGPQLQGKPMKWHCSPSEFWSKYPEFLKSEVYCQNDTRGIFLKEAEELPIPKRNIQSVLI